MKRTRLRFLIAPMWLINIVFLFGSLFSLFSNEDGQLPLRILGVVGLLFIFSIYLFNDALQFKRPLFLKIIGVTFILSALLYIFVGNYLLVLPVMATGILVLYLMR